MFHKCKNIKDLRKTFIYLAKLLHPDLGGDHEAFVLLRESYEIATVGFEGLQEFEEKINTSKEKNPRKFEMQVEDVFEGDPLLDMIDHFYTFANLNKNFNLDYVKSIQEYLEKNGFITSSQFNSLVKNYYAFRINDKIEEHDLS